MNRTMIEVNKFLAPSIENIFRHTEGQRMKNLEAGPVSSRCVDSECSLCESKGCICLCHSSEDDLGSSKVRDYIKDSVRSLHKIREKELHATLLRYSEWLDFDANVITAPSDHTPQDDRTHDDLVAGFIKYLRDNKIDTS